MQLAYITLLRGMEQLEINCWLESRKLHFSTCDALLLDGLKDAALVSTLACKK